MASPQWATHTKCSNDSTSPRGEPNSPPKVIQALTNPVQETHHQLPMLPMCLWHSPFPGTLSGPSKCSASAQSRAEVGNALGQQLMVVTGQIPTPSHLRCVSQSPQWGPRSTCPGTHTASATLLPSSWPPFFTRTCWNPLPDKLPACKSSSPHFRVSFRGAH